MKCVRDATGRLVDKELENAAKDCGSI